MIAGLRVFAGSSSVLPVWPGYETTSRQLVRH